MTICIRSMTDADLDASEAVAVRAYGRQDTWRSDIEFYLNLEPDGCYVATVADRVVGFGGGIVYGSLAWIGLMCVHPNEQGHGIGRSILDRILSWTTVQKCATAVLDASDAGTSLYSHAGFVEEGMTGLYERVTNHVAASNFHPDVSTCRASDWAALVAFDHLIFGANRRRMLTSLCEQNPSRVFVTRDASEAITGYVVAQPGRIGPWLARSPDQAEVLLEMALSVRFPVPPVVYAPSQNSDVAELLSCRDFVQRRALRHMYRGPHPAQDRTRVYGQGGLSLG